MSPPLMQKKSYIKSGEGSVASYSWTEIQTGEGYITYNGMGITDSVGINRYLLTNTTNANPTKTQTATGIGDQALATFVTLPFNSTRITGTKAFLDFRWSSLRGSAGTANHTITATLYKSDGVTDTSLGSVISSALSVTSTTASQRRESLIISTNKIVMKRGEYFKLIFTTNHSHANSRSGIYHDPLNVALNDDLGGGSFAVADTYFKLQQPFKIDL